MRRILNLLFVVALLARGMMPQGFMLAPDAGSDGAFSVVICTGHGPERMVLDDDGNPQPAEQDDTSSVCPFAASAPLAFVSPAPDLAPPAHFGVHAPRSRAEAIAMAPRHGLPDPARGPPTHS